MIAITRSRATHVPSMRAKSEAAVSVAKAKGQPTQKPNAQPAKIALV